MKYAFLASVLIGAQVLQAQTPLIQTGESVAFLGDSITAAGARLSGGYVRLAESGLKENGIEIQVIPAGVSGNKSGNMLARLQQDVLDKKPVWMTLSCGVNDVWHQEKGTGTSLEDYKKNLTELVDRTQKAGVKVMILTSTLIGENLKKESNIKAVEYNAFLRELAKQRQLPLADLNEDMRRDVEKGQKLTVDGVHMNPAGNKMMARGVLKAFGLNAEQMAKAEEGWNKAPKMSLLSAAVEISVDDRELLKKRAKGQSFDDYTRGILEAAILKEVNAAKAKE
jgi:lysophospholipase L1-like esterase